MQIMTVIGGKRLETVPVKFSESEKAELQRLAFLEDRGVGYIVRELAFRGLALYKQDGLLKITTDEEKTITSSNKKSAPVDNAQVVGTPVFPQLEEVAEVGNKNPPVEILGKIKPSNTAHPVNRKAR
jgi:hypothetical protein